MPPKVPGDIDGMLASRNADNAPLLPMLSKGIESRPKPASKVGGKVVATIGPPPPPPPLPVQQVAVGPTARPAFSAGAAISSTSAAGAARPINFANSTATALGSARAAGKHSPGSVQPPAQSPQQRQSIESTDSLEELRKTVADLQTQVAEVGDRKANVAFDSGNPPYFSPTNQLNSPNLVSQLERSRWPTENFVEDFSSSSGTSVGQVTEVRTPLHKSIELADRRAMGTERTSSILKNDGSEFGSPNSRGSSKKSMQVQFTYKSDNDSNEDENELHEEPRKFLRTRGFTWVNAHHDYYRKRDQVAIAAAQVLGAASYLIMLEYTKVKKKSDDGKETLIMEYTLYSTVLISSVIQNVILLTVALAKDGKAVFVLNWPVFYYSLISGGFWAVTENLTTVAASFLAPSTVALLQQTRVVFTALIRSMLLGFHLTELHWHGLFLLIISVVGYHFWRVSNYGVDAKSHAAWEMELGAGVAVLSAMFYGFATVFTEKLYRAPRFAMQSFETKHFYIASRKLAFCIVYTVIMQIRLKRNFFLGWNVGVVFVCVCQAIQVLGTHFTLRRLDSVLCAICEVVSVAIVWTTQNLVFGTTFQPVALCFVLLVIQSVFIFGRVAPVVGHESDEGVTSFFTGRWLHAMDAMEARATTMRSTVMPMAEQKFTRLKSMVSSVSKSRG